MNEINEMRARITEFDNSETVVRECFVCVAGENYSKDVCTLLLINKALCDDIRTLHNTVAIAQRETAQARKERDAAVEDLRKASEDCSFCAHMPCVIDGKSVFDDGACHWKWRGMEVEG